MFVGAGRFDISKGFDVLINAFAAVARIRPEVRLLLAGAGEERPNYMKQLNEFIRTFSSAFNKTHKEGYDLDGNQGIDFFNAKDLVTGDNYEFLGLTEGFSSLIDMSVDNKASYYSMTALNCTVTQEVMDNVRLLAGSGPFGDGADYNPLTDGISNNANIQHLLRIKEDKGMFRQGTPDGFLQTLASSMGIDANKAMTFMHSQDNIVSAIDNQRTSVSGVDEDEEGSNLVKFQNLLFFQFKVISIMDEVFDKLINGTAV